MGPTLLTSLLISSLPTSAQAAQEDAKQQGMSEGGEVTLLDDQKEEVTLRYQYGEISENSANDQNTMKNLANNIALVNQTMNSENELLYFVEEGQENTKLPDELAERNNVRKVVLPHTLVSGFKKFWKETAVTPHGKEVMVGTVLLLARAKFTYAVWAAAPGVSPNLAITITAMSAGITGMMTIFGQAVHNMVAYGLMLVKKGDDSGANEAKLKKGALPKLLFRYASVDFAVNSLLNLVSGRNSWWQIFGTTVITNSITTTSMTAQNVLLKNQRALTVSMALILSPITYTLQALEGAAASKVWFTIGAYEARYSMIHTFELFAAILFMKIVFPKQVLWTLEKVDSGVHWVYRSIKYTFTKTKKAICGLIMKPAPSKDFDADDFVSSEI